MFSFEGERGLLNFQFLYIIIVGYINISFSRNRLETVWMANKSIFETKTYIKFKLIINNSIAYINVCEKFQLSSCHAKLGKSVVI